MKQLTCEMCGSTDLIKQDGVFVCQSCGTKYSIEEAKKMMVEGTVEVAGTVKVDSTDKITNYLMMANNAYDASNQKEAEQYCNKVIEIDPENYQAWLLKGKAAGWQSTLGNIRIEEAVNCFGMAVEYVPEEKREEVKRSAADELDKLSFALVSLTCDNYAKNGSEHNAKEIRRAVQLVTLHSVNLLLKCGISGTDLKAKIASKINSSVVAAYQNDIVPDYWGPTRHPSQVAWSNYKGRAMEAVSLLYFAIDLSESDAQEDKVKYENIIHILNEVKSSSSYHYVAELGWRPEYCLPPNLQQELIDKIQECHKKIKEIDPSHAIPEPAKPNTSAGCYVATAVYGSYDCPEVWTLRRFRDYTLAKRWYGRAFIHIYYAISPTLVKRFGHAVWFKKLWKEKLDRMVANLNAKGIEDTPYEDRIW